MIASHTTKPAGKTGKTQIHTLWTRTSRTELRKLVTALRAKREELARLGISYANASKEARKGFAADIKACKAACDGLTAEIKAGRAGTRYKSPAAILAALQGATTAKRMLTRSERRDLLVILESIAAGNGVSLSVQLALAA